MDDLNTYRKNPSVACTELDDGAVLLNLDTKHYYNLNETGLRIWQIMEECRNIMEIAEKLADEYKIDVEGAKTGVVKLIRDLEKDGLITTMRKEDQ